MNNVWTLNAITSVTCFLAAASCFVAGNIVCTVLGVLDVVLGAINVVAAVRGYRNRQYEVTSRQITEDQRRMPVLHISR